MRFLKLFLIVFLCNFLFARSDKLSNITLPQSSFLNIYLETCDENCMQNLIDKKLILSFLSIYDSDFSNKYIEETYFIYGQALSIFPAEKIEQKHDGRTRLAVLIPQKTIGRYATSTVNTAIAYLLTQSNEFEITIFNSNDEEEESIIGALDKIREEEYTYVIAPVTQDGAKILLDYSIGLQIFIPTLHSSIFSYTPSNIVFGGIDYGAQIRELQPYSNGLATLFSDGSMLSESINDMIMVDNDVIFQETFGSTNMDFKKFFTHNNISQTSVYYNTPLITTSLISSQIRAYKGEPFVQLSTQINYSPTLLTLTQYEDRKNMYIASSINDTDDNLKSISAIFGQNLNYDWVSYATAIGIEYFATNFFESNFKKFFNEDISNSQVNYDINIYKAGYFRFVKQDKFIENTNGSEELHIESDRGIQDSGIDQKQHSIPTLRDLSVF